MTTVVNMSSLDPLRKPNGPSQKDSLDDIKKASQESLYETAEYIVNEKTANSEGIDASLEDRIPRFDLEEMRLGRILGRGGFCIAIEIDKMKISEPASKGGSVASNSFFARFNSRSDSKDLDIDGENSGNGESNVHKHAASVAGGTTKGSAFPRTTGMDISRVTIARLAQKRSRKGGRFVLKRVKPEMYASDKIQFLKGIVDLTMESKLLAALDHPNIISLCGISSKGPAHFIILEKLMETLSNRLRKWTQIDRQCKGITGIFTGSKRKVAELYEDRISTAYDVACAGDYLHQLKIVFRDLVSFSCL